MNKVHVSYHGDRGQYVVNLDGEAVYATADRRDADMFAAELKGRLSRPAPEPPRAHLRSPS